MSLSEIVCLIVAVSLIGIGVHAVFAQYHANLLRLRWAWAMTSMPAEVRVYMPRILGAIFLAGGLYLLVDTLIGMQADRGVIAVVSQ